ncbi:Uncharacterised protein [Yersinia enterocolitica]|nr:Uncharacterised protein [Yersinia enterocolitica]
MAIQEALINGIILNNVIGDVIHNHQIGLWGKDDRVISQFKAAMFKSRQYRNSDMLIRQATAGHA